MSAAWVNGYGQLWTFFEIAQFRNVNIIESFSLTHFASIALDFVENNHSELYVLFNVF